MVDLQDISKSFIACVLIFLCNITFTCIIVITGITPNIERMNEDEVIRVYFP